MIYNPGYLNLLLQDDLNSLLGQAAFTNDFKKIKYLLTSPELNQHAKINSDYDILATICSKGDLKTLKYVLTSTDLKEHANIHLNNEKAIISAINVGNIPMIKYLLTDSELKEHSNLYFLNNGYKVIEAIFEVSFEMSEKLVDYFTLDYAKKKKDVEIFLKLTEYADDIDLEEQITNNLFSLIVKEKNKEHNEKLKYVLKELDEDKYNMLNSYLLNKELDKELKSNEPNKNKKMKV